MPTVPPSIARFLELETALRAQHGDGALYVRPKILGAVSVLLSR